MDAAAMQEGKRWPALVGMAAALVLRLCVPLVLGASLLHFVDAFNFEDFDGRHPPEFVAETVAAWRTVAIGLTAVALAALALAFEARRAGRAGRVLTRQ